MGDAIFQLPDSESHNILANYPACPADPAQPQETSPSVVAARYWEDIPLPKPAPYVAPGWAITGKLAYLETNGETHKTYTNSTPVGGLQIDATGTYSVDWGDGTTSGPYSLEGTPWPDGQITHEYIYAKAYNITVTEHWTATWQLGPNNGSLDELQTAGTIDNFPAREIQAVIR